LLGQRDVGAIFSIIPTPEIVVAGTIVVVGGYRRDHAYLAIFAFGTNPGWGD
jgi:hypothetical protein